jgi:hypothetical protein
MIFILYECKSYIKNDVWHGDIRKKFFNYRNASKKKKCCFNLRLFFYIIYLRLFLNKNYDKMSMKRRKSHSFFIFKNHDLIL